jgi:hypothetical protein
MDIAKLVEAQLPDHTKVYADDGVYAGLVLPNTRWECGTCLASGVGGAAGLLVHDADHMGDPA